MNPESVQASLPVLLIGVLIWVMPSFTHPTLQFGVRLPDDRVGSDVIRRERRSYSQRTAALAVIFTMATALSGSGPGPGFAIILMLQLASGLGCFWLARRRITAAKLAQRWFDGLTQTVVTDTTWRTEPERFPVLWVLPAAAVLVTTLVAGVIRYPSLPARYAVHFDAAGSPDGWSQKSIWSAFAPVATQLLVTALIVGLLMLTYRSRPDVDAADALGSTQRYRRFLSAMTRSLLTMLALANLTVLLSALAIWQVYRLSGFTATVAALPTMVGVVLVITVALRMGQGGSKLAPAPGDSEPGSQSPGEVNRDDDRFWKGGLIYVNRDDPTFLVPKRFGVGWTFNFANPWAWVFLAAVLTLSLGASVATYL